MFIVYLPADMLLIFWHCVCVNLFTILPLVSFFISIFIRNFDAFSIGAKPLEPLVEVYWTGIKTRLWRSGDTSHKLARLDCMASAQRDHFPIREICTDKIYFSFLFFFFSEIFVLILFIQFTRSLSSYYQRNYIYSSFKCCLLHDYMEIGSQVITNFKKWSPQKVLKSYFLEY